MFRALLHSADDLFNSDGAFWILALDGILLIPLIFAGFFYPLAVLGGVGATLVLTIAVLMLVRPWDPASSSRNHVEPGSGGSRSGLRSGPA